MDDLIKGSGQSDAGALPDSQTLSQGQSGAFVVWVSGEDANGFGRIMLRLTQDSAAQDLDAPISAFFPANDNVVWVGDEFGSGEGGAIGRDPSLLGLDSGDTLVAWVGEDRGVHGRVYPGVDGADDFGASVSTSAYQDLNEALANLTSSDARPALAEKGRLHLQDLGLGQFAILWAAITAAGAYELQGVVFNRSQAGGEAAEQGAAGWQRSDVAPEPIGEIGASQGEIIILGGSSSDSLLNLDIRVDGGAVQNIQLALVEDASAPLPGDTDSEDASADGSLPAASAGVDQPADAAAQRVEADVVDLFLDAVALTVGDAVDESGAQIFEDRPAVAATSSGELIIGHMQVGSDGQGTFVLNRYGADGQRIVPDDGAAAVVVSRSAAANGPAVVGSVSDRTVAVWLEEVDGGSELRVQTFGRDGSASGPATVAAVAQDDLVISDVSVTQTHVEDSDAPDQLVIAWVEDDDGDGYGAIHMQRYSWRDDDDDDEDGELVALGHDGSVDGDDSETTQLSDPEEAPGGTIEGRDIATAGLSDGDVAVAWVERETVEVDGVKTTIETISGRVLQAVGGSTVFHIDIQDLNGFESVNDQFAPQLLATGRGDLVVGWIGNKDGDYVAQVAVYNSLGNEVWGIPDHVIDLKDFGESRPRNFDITIVGGDVPNIMLTWRESGKIYSQRYDLDGAAVGNKFIVWNGSDSDDASAVDTVGAGGTFVVVYSEADEDGDDVDIEARIFDLGPAESTSGSSTQDAEVAAAMALEPAADVVAADASQQDEADATADEVPVDTPEVPSILGNNTDSLVFAISNSSGSGSSGSSGSGSDIDTEILQALEGADTFYFRDEFGAVSIVDFDIDQDMLEISSDIVDNYDDLWLAIESLVDGAQFDFGSGNVVFISGVDASGLNINNVRIVDDTPV